MTSYPSRAAQKVMVVYDTRPEAIKMAPSVLALDRDRRFDVKIVVTGQHRSMLDQVHECFGIHPHIDLNIHIPGQSLTEVTTLALTGLSEVVSAERPDLLMVQGATRRRHSWARWQASTRTFL